MTEKLIRDFLTIWVTIEPISSLALFVALSAGLDERERRRVALRACLYAAAILLGAIVIGQILLAALDISIEAFQVAGGIVLFLFGLQMIFGTTPGSTGSELAEAGRDLAVFPLAIPSIVGPEAILAVILLTDNHLYPITTQALTSVVMLFVLALTFGLMLLAERVLRVIGRNGSAILERLMGMLLTALSVELVMRALGITP